MARRRPSSWAVRLKPSTSGYSGTTAITCRSGCAAQRLGEDAADVVAPEVLVLDVDQVPGPLDGLGVAAGDAALAAAGERVVAAPAQVRVGAEQLDDVRHRRRPAGAAAPARAAGRGWCRARAGGRGAGSIGLRLRVVGSSHRSRKTVSTSWTAGPLMAAWMSCHGGVSPYSSARLSRACGSPPVVGVVAARVAQVDAADVGDVARRVVAVPDDDQLLVVASRRCGPACRGSPRRRASAGPGRGAGSRRT